MVLAEDHHLVADLHIGHIGNINHGLIHAHQANNGAFHILHGAPALIVGEGPGRAVHIAEGQRGDDPVMIRLVVQPVADALARRQHLQVDDLALQLHHGPQGGDMGVEAIEEGAGTDHVIAHLRIADGADTVVDAL